MIPMGKSSMLCSPKTAIARYSPCSDTPRLPIFLIGSGAPTNQLSFFSTQVTAWNFAGDPRLFWKLKGEMRQTVMVSPKIGLYDGVSQHGTVPVVSGFRLTIVVGLMCQQVPTYGAKNPIVVGLMYSFSSQLHLLLVCSLGNNGRSGGRNYADPSWVAPEKRNTNWAEHRPSGFCYHPPKMAFFWMKTDLPPLKLAGSMSNFRGYCKPWLLPWLLLPNLGFCASAHVPFNYEPWQDLDVLGYNLGIWAYIYTPAKWDTDLGI